MANLEIEGRISQKFPVQSGQSARGLWEKQDFVLEYQDGNFPASACFTAFGSDKVKELAPFKVGDAVKVAFNLRGREYNGRWYNDLRVWKVTAAGAAAPQQYGAAPAAPQYSPAPQYGQPAGPTPVAPAPGLDDIPAAEPPENDLPF